MRHTNLHTPGDTPVTNSKTSNSNHHPSPYTGAIDHLEVSQYVAWPRPTWDILRKKLVAAADAASDSSARSGSAFISLDGNRVHVSRLRHSGGMPGPFLLRVSSATITIADQPRFHANWPNVVITVPGRACLLRRAMDAYSAAWKVMMALNPALNPDRVRRLDLAVDLPGVAMDYFSDADRFGRVITRADEPEEWRSTGRSLVYGKPLPVQPDISQLNSPGYSAGHLDSPLYHS